MTDTAKFDVRALSFQDVVIVHASIDNKSRLVALDKKYTFQVTFKMDLAINFEVSTMRVIFICDVKAVQKEDKKAIGVSGKFEIAFFYKVADLTKWVGTPDNMIQNDDLDVTISNLTYSTARGIMFTRCQGTLLKSWILPILPTVDLADLRAKGRHEITKKNKKHKV